MYGCSIQRWESTLCMYHGVVWVLARLTSPRRAMESRAGCLYVAWPTLSQRPVYPVSSRLVQLIVPPYQGHIGTPPEGFTPAVRDRPTPLRCSPVMGHRRQPPAALPRSTLHSHSLTRRKTALQHAMLRENCRAGPHLGRDRYETVRHPAARRSGRGSSRWGPKGSLGPAAGESLGELGP